jgi:hypothetical protein
MSSGAASASRGSGGMQVVICGSTSSRGCRSGLATSFDAGSVKQSTIDLDSNNNNFSGSSSNSSSSETELEAEDACCVCLLCGVVRINKDYSQGPRVILPDADGAALATLGGVELWAPTLFASCSIVCTGGFTKTNLLICLHSLHWNLTVPFLQSNCNE